MSSALIFIIMAVAVAVAAYVVVERRGRTNWEKLLTSQERREIMQLKKNTVLVARDDYGLYCVLEDIQKDTHSCIMAASSRDELEAVLEYAQLCNALLESYQSLSPRARYIDELPEKFEELVEQMQAYGDTLKAIATAYLADQSLPQLEEFGRKLRTMQHRNAELKAVVHIDESEWVRPVQ